MKLFRETIQKFFNQSGSQGKVGRVFPMIILSESCEGQYRDDDHFSKKSLENPKNHINFQVEAGLEKRDIRIVQCVFTGKFFEKIQKKKSWKEKKTQM